MISHSASRVVLVLGVGLVACSPTSSAPQEGSGTDAGPATSMVDGGAAAQGSPDGGSSTQSSACSSLADFRATSTSSTGISLAWSPSAGVQFTLARKSYCDTDNYQTVATLPAGTSSYTDTQVQPNWVYWYELTATDASNDTASVVLAAQAASVSQPGCSGGATPQSSGVSSGACGASMVNDAAVSPASDSSPESSPGNAAGELMPLDCANSTQPALCAYLNTAVTPTSPPATLSTACENPTNVVSITPSNFATALGSITAGQTAVFAQGTYNFTSNLSLVSGVNYCGQGGDPTKVVLQAATNNFFFTGGDISNVVIDGLTFDTGAGLNPNSYSNVFIQHNVFQNVTGSWPTSQGILLVKATSTTVAQNLFRANTTGIIAYELHDVVIADNGFSTTQEGMHLMFQLNSDSIRVARNTFTEGHRIMIELQGNDSTPMTGLVVEDNAVLFPLQGGYSDTYGMGISVAIPDDGQSPVIRNNWLFGPVGNYQTLGVLGIELAGSGDQVTGNIMQYWYSGMSFSTNGPSMSVTNNSMCDIVTPFTQDGGFNGYPNVSTNNSCVKGSQGYAL
jgi:hypothetical protein